MAQSSRIDRVSAERKGRRAEWIAAAFLCAKGYRILSRRYKSRVGEIDLIAMNGKTLVFVEVKARPTHEVAIFSVSETAQKRIQAAADLWCAHHPRFHEFGIRFDIISVVGFSPKHLIDAWRS